MRLLIVRITRLINVREMRLLNVRMTRLIDVRKMRPYNVRKVPNIKGSGSKERTTERLELRLQQFMGGD